MHGIDLEIAPIQRSIGIVVVDLARASRILGALNGQGNSALWAELVTSVLLVGRQAVAGLIGLGPGGVLSGSLRRRHQRPLKVESDRRLKAEGVLGTKDEDCERCDHRHKQNDAAKNRGDRRLAPAAPREPSPVRGSGYHGAAPLRDWVGGCLTLL